MLILLETMAEESRSATAPELLEPVLLRLAKGDQDALGELYHRTRASVYGLALSFLKHAHDAEDVTQDTFIRVWENAPRYQPQGTPLAWILAVARNLSLMKLRERGKTQVVVLHAVTGWKHREIAQLLELPLSTVLSKYRRALQKLKITLEGGTQNG